MSRNGCSQCWGSRVLARHVKNCIGVFGFSIQHLDGFGGGQDKQFDLVARGLALDFPHYRQSAVRTAADDELTAFPRNLFFDRRRGVSGLLFQSHGRPLLAFAKITADNYYSLFVKSAADQDGAERK